MVEEGKHRSREGSERRVIDLASGLFSWKRTQHRTCHTRRSAVRTFSTFVVSVYCADMCVTDGSMLWFVTAAEAIERGKERRRELERVGTNTQTDT